MKNLLIIALIAAPFLSQKATAKESKDLVLLTPEQYVSLYEADKKKYIQLLRQMAADLSFQPEIGFFEGLNIKAPAWVNLIANNCEASPYTENDMQLQINLLNKQADDYLKSRNPVEYVSQAAGHLIDPESDRRDRAAKATIVDRLFRIRNKLVDEVALLPESAQINLARSLRPLDSKFNSVKIKARGLRLPRLRVAVQRSLDAYDEKLKKLKKPAWEIARQPGLQIEVVESALEARTAPPAPASPSIPNVVVSGESCVRCVYGGFPISNTQKCSAVKTSEEMTAQLGTLRFPPPLKIEDFNCGSDKPVMCSPMFFGTLEGKAVCVRQSSSATRTCMNTVGNSEESYRSTDKIMRLNSDAARSMMTRFTNICTNKSLCYAGAKKSDIEQTCKVVRERMQNFLEGMRTIDGAPAPAPPAPAPTGIST